MAAAVAASAATSARAECSLETHIVPLPVWATTPNEGSTWGAMPVFLHMCPDDHRTHWILAPSVTWNSVIHYTGTVRWYDYPDDDTTLFVHASASTRINYGASILWQRLPTDVGAWTHEATGRVERDAFDRFFGIGPDTSASAESSYTGVRAIASDRLGLNVYEDVNVGLTLAAERDGVDNTGVVGLPLSPEAFPDAPGMHGATLLSQGIDVRYDDRAGFEFADSGTRVDAWAAVVEGLRGSPNFVRVGAQANGIVPELSWLSGAARVYWNMVSSSQAPFYQQSALGGAFLLRGFTEGRFVDRQAWMIEVEQRIRVWQSHWFGVLTDWRIDPFIATGQVFGSFDAAFSRPQLAGGLGLRGFVHPKVVGRVDFATGGEGLKVYVEIGYPY